jgi:hypothetical protein
MLLLFHHTAGTEDLLGRRPELHDDTAPRPANGHEIAAAERPLEELASFAHIHRARASVEHAPKSEGIEPVEAREREGHGHVDGARRPRSAALEHQEVADGIAHAEHLFACYFGPQQWRLLGFARRAPT